MIVRPGGRQYRYETTTDRISGYERTADSLVLHRPWRVDTRLALADLDDPDAVEAAIGRYLPTSDRRD